jgi:small-conductance mechanosensitive channel
MLDKLTDYFSSLWTTFAGLFSRLDIKSLAIALGATFLATVILVIVFRLIRRVFQGLYNRISTLKGTRIRALRVQRQEILSDDDIETILCGILKVLKLIVWLLVIYLYLQFVFRFFPWTQGLAEQLFAYLYEGFSLVLSAIVEYLPNLILIGIILLVTNYIIKLAQLIFNGIGTQRIRLPGFYPEWARPTFNLVRLLVFAFVLIVIFPYLPGSGSPAFQGISIFFGVLLSLGSTAAVANMVAGVVITYMRAFQIGDRVKIADAVGDVVEKTLFVTRVRTIKNVDITIPNAMVLSNHIINFSTLSKKHGLILNTTVTLGYDLDWRKVHELLIAAAKSTKMIGAHPEPFVHQTSLDDFYVTYEINAFTKHPKEMVEIYSELRQNILDRFNEAGVEITSPHYAALRDGNSAAIPDEHLPKDYSSPSFRIWPLDKFPGQKKD